MGSLASRPKAPQAPQPQVVYVPAPARTPAPSGTVPENKGSEPAPGDPGKKVAEEKTEARSESLLKRDRSRFGTVLTGFRGLLSSAAPNPQRKTLLGE